MINRTDIARINTAKMNVPKTEVSRICVARINVVGMNVSRIKVARTIVILTSSHYLSSCSINLLILPINDVLYKLYVICPHSHGEVFGCKYLKNNVTDMKYRIVSIT